MPPAASDQASPHAHARAPPNRTRQGYEIVSTAIVVYFMVELCLRIFAIGCVAPRACWRPALPGPAPACLLTSASRRPSHFFRQPWEVFDFVIITVSFIFEFAFEVGR